MTKIVYNACFGGFGLSEAAMRRYAEIKGYEFRVEPDSEFQSFKNYFFNGERVYESDMDEKRTDPVLAQVVEELGKAASGSYSELCVYELPAGTKYRIEEYDGLEHIETEDDIKWSVA